MVSGQPMTPMSCPGNNLEKPHLAWVINSCKTIRCMRDSLNVLHYRQQNKALEGKASSISSDIVILWLERLKLNLLSGLVYIVNISVHGSECYLIITFVFSPEHTEEHYDTVFTT